MGEILRLTRPHLLCEVNTDVYECMYVCVCVCGRAKLSCLLLCCSHHTQTTHWDSPSGNRHQLLLTQLADFITHQADKVKVGLTHSGLYMCIEHACGAHVQWNGAHVQWRVMGHMCSEGCLIPFHVFFRWWRNRWLKRENCSWRRIRN